MLFGGGRFLLMVWFRCLIACWLELIVASVVCWFVVGGFSMCGYIVFRFRSCLFWC